MTGATVLTLPTIRQLQMFVALARFQNFRRAAQALGVTQSALSQSIKQIEFLINVPLLQRNQRHVALTSAGQAFLPHAVRVLDNLATGVDLVRNAGEPETGSVTIACMSSTLLRLMPAVVESFRKLHPGLKIHVLEVDAVGMGDRVRQGEADFAISVMFNQDLALDFGPLIEDELHLVCRPDHAFATREQMSWSELTSYGIQQTVQWSGIAYLVADIGGLEDIRGRATYSVTRISTVLDIISESGLVSVLPTLALAAPSIKRKFHHCPMVEPRINRSIGLITPRERPMSPTASALREVLLHTLQKFGDEGLPGARLVRGMVPSRKTLPSQPSN
ncbi:LysR family transcriptional regulator [Pelagibacterium nitratireducens]|uniref:LysR family transcriptional regulator n=1 Tax=Pelagibacterium nitratireducens TaxID=1046114 RepID=A0ABZ2I5M1_9HYPH